MHRVPVPLVLACCGVLWGAFGLSGPCLAQRPTARVSIAASAGGTIMAMDDVNHRIGAANDFLGSKGWTTLDDVGIGFSFDGDLRARLFGPVGLSIGGGTTFGETGVDFDEVITVKPRANLYHFRVTYDLPWHPLRKLGFRLGAGPVNVAKAECEVTHEVRRVEGGTQRIEKVTYKGDGWGGHGFLEAEYTLNDRVTLTGSLGYRQLSVDRNSYSWGISEINLPFQDDDGDDILNGWDLDIDSNGTFEPFTVVGAAFLEMVRRGGTPVQSAPGQPVIAPRDLGTLDFSGPILNVGLRFYLF